MAPLPPNPRNLLLRSFRTSSLRRFDRIGPVCRKGVCPFDVRVTIRVDSVRPGQRKPSKGTNMKVIVMIKGDGADEDKIAPTEQMLREMGEFNERLVDAGIMLDGQGLQPSAKGAQVVFRAGSTSVVDGPFTESKEVIAGYWVWQVSSLEEAIEWARQCPSDPSFEGRQVLEIRPIFSEDDFGAEYTPELRERDAQLNERIKAQHGES
jgi:hypothetical protein